MSSQALPIYPVTLMVQSSCTFYRDLICKLFEYASPCSISLRESEAGERGGGFWEHKICWAPGRHFNLSRLEASWVLWGSASACSLPRQGGVWITLRALKADICLPWAWGAARCCLLGLLWLAWGLHNSAHRSGCSWLGCSTLWQQALPGASPSTLQSCWELWLQRCWRLLIWVSVVRQDQAHSPATRTELWVLVSELPVIASFWGWEILGDQWEGAEDSGLKPNSSFPRLPRERSNRA